MAAIDHLLSSKPDAVYYQTITDHAEAFLRKEGKKLHPALDLSATHNTKIQSGIGAMPFEYVLSASASFVLMVLCC